MIQKKDQLLNSYDFKMKPDFLKIKTQVLPQLPRNKTTEFKRNTESDNQISLNKYVSPGSQLEQNKQKFNISQSIKNIESNYQKALTSKLPIKKQFDDKRQTQQIKKVQKIEPLVGNQNNEDSRFSLSSIPKIVQSKHSSKQNGIIQSYAANTHNGHIRSYNEDRVSIILNISRPDCKKNGTFWPECSFFAVYDGHGGSKCADLLRDQLHQMIVRDDHFPQDPKKAIIRSIYKFEKMFIELNLQNRTTQIDRSGSCIILAMIVERKCYIGNVGDSRALMISNNGKTISNLSFDHKPEHIIEQTRIVENGGQIYKSYIKQITQSGPQIIYGPLRVFPGRLSVSRTIGDIEAKLQQLGGNPKCVVCKPDIKIIDIQDNDDFLFLGCDGIFEKLDNKQVITSVLKQEIQTKDFHVYGRDCVDNMMREVLMSKSMDNLTAVIITFKSFYNQFENNVQQSNFKDQKTYQNKNNFTEIEFQYEEEDSFTKAQEKDLQYLFNLQAKLETSQSTQFLSSETNKLIKK